VTTTDAHIHVQACLDGNGNKIPGCLDGLNRDPKKAFEQTGHRKVYVRAAVPIVDFEQFSANWEELQKTLFENPSKTVPDFDEVRAQLHSLMDNQVSDDEVQAPTASVAEADAIETEAELSEEATLYHFADTKTRTDELLEQPVSGSVVYSFEKEGVKTLISDTVLIDEASGAEFEVLQFARLGAAQGTNQPVLGSYDLDLGYNEQEDTITLQAFESQADKKNYVLIRASRQEWAAATGIEDLSREALRLHQKEILQALPEKLWDFATTKGAGFNRQSIHHFGAFIMKGEGIVGDLAQVIWYEAEIDTPVLAQGVKDVVGVLGEYVEVAVDYAADRIPNAVKEKYQAFLDHTTPQERKVLEYVGTAGIAGFIKQTAALRHVRKLNAFFASKLTVKSGKLKGFGKGFSLKHHEGGIHNGHAIERHVAKNKKYLKSRGLTYASSYPDLKTANEVTQAVIQKNEKEIAAWFGKAKPGKTEEFRADFGKPIGYGLKKGDNVLQLNTEALVVLKKMNNGEIKVVTSYPID
jgi:hypothetical protein